MALGESPVRAHFYLLSQQVHEELLMRIRPMQFLCIVAVATSAAAAFAQNPFLGTWKMDNEKSHLTGDVIEFSPAPGGAIKFTAEDRSYTFKTDGKEYTGSTGAQYVWKMTDDNDYERTAARNGVPLGTTTYKISSDGKTLVAKETGTSPSGKSFDDTTKYTRVAGTKGLMGSWKDTDVKMKEDQVMVWKAGSSADSMRWELPDLKAYVDIAFDGKECTPVGPTVPKGLTLSLTKTGPHTLQMVEKLNGEVLVKASYKLLPDGKTLTEVEAPPDGKAPATIIYEKQST
jgi:hypothetical protein